MASQIETIFLFYDDDGNPLVAMHWQYSKNVIKSDI